jgi:hypothetical protein
MRGKWFPLLVAGMVAVLAGQAFAAGEVDIKPGKWEITSSMQMPGMPAGMQAMSFTHIQCLKTDDLVPEDPNPNSQGDCQTQDVRVEGDTVTWKMICESEQGKITSSGRISYHGTTFEGAVQTRIPGQDMEITNQLQGRWVGPCD